MQTICHFHQICLSAVVSRQTKPRQICVLQGLESLLMATDEIEAFMLYVCLRGKGEGEIECG